MKTKFNRNRNIIIFAICFLFVYVENICSQISVPDPSIYLAFDTTDPAYESISKRSGVYTGASQQWVDRFGNINRSIRFDGKGSGICLSGYDINTVHTVSFWLDIYDPSEIPAGAIPFSPTDTMGRMHSDAQFAGSSSVPAHVEMMGFLGIGNNPMVGCTVACAVDVAQALSK